MKSWLGGLAGVLLVATAWAADWPQWLGPTRDGVCPDLGLPDRLPTERPRPRWRYPLGGGYSGVAVAGGRVFTLDYRNKPREVERVVCLDAATGKLLWSHSYPVRYAGMEY